MATVLDARSEHRLDTTRFHFRMAIVFVVVAFLGFTPTYWARIVSGTFSAPPIVHIHGALLFGWTLLYLAQTSLVASTNIRLHRSVGLIGIALFSVMCCTIVATRLVLLHGEIQQGYGDAARRFSAVALCSLPLLAGFFIAAVANVRRPEIHRRLMYLLMVALMIPAIARVFLVLLQPAGASGGPPPTFVVIPPTLTAALLVLPAIIHDRRRLGRVHPVLIYGSLTVVLWTLTIVPFASTSAWLAVIRTLEHLSG